MSYGCFNRERLVAIVFQPIGTCSVGRPWLQGKPVPIENKCHYTLSPGGKTDPYCVGCRLNVNPLAPQKVL